MSKVELDPITSGYNLSKINSNFQRIESELNEKVLYRGPPPGEPNHMNSDLDMNGHSILNANKISTTVLEIGGVPVIPGSVVIDPFRDVREALRRTYAEVGYTLVNGSFEVGGVLTDITDVLLYEASGVAYSGSGPYPQTVAPNTNPTLGGFLDQSDRVLGGNTVSLVGYGASPSASALANSDAIDAALAANPGKVIDGCGIAIQISRKILLNGTGLANISLTTSHLPGVTQEPIVEMTGENPSLSGVVIDCGSKDFLGVLLNGSIGAVVDKINVSNGKWGGLYTRDAQDTVIRNSEFSDCGGTFLGGTLQISENSSNSLVEMCKISGALGKAFTVQDSIDTTFSHCRSHNAIYENFAPVRGSIRTLFYKCISTKNRVGDIASGMKASRGASFVVFDHCLFEQIGGDGVVTPFHNMGCSNILVRDCIMRGDTDQLVLMSWHDADPPSFPVALPSNDVVFERCHFDCVSAGQALSAVRLDPSFGFDFLKRITFRDCFFDRFQSYGLFSNQVIDLTIDSCRFSSSVQTGSTAYQMLLQGPSSNPEFSSGARVINNIYETPSGYALGVANSKEFYISGNKFVGKTDKTNTLINMFGSKLGVLSGNLFKQFTKGIDGADSTQLTITANIFDNGGTGTGCELDGLDNIIAENYFNVLNPTLPTTNRDDTTFYLNSDKRVLYRAAAPGSGPWVVGDLVYNTAPAAGGNIGWVCVTAGTPGTWKTFGTISA